LFSKADSSDPNIRQVPHNPMINAGAIMTAALIHPNETPAERFTVTKQVII
jgi:glutaminase